MCRIRILGCNDDFPDSSGDDCAGARWCPSMGGAWFKRDKKGGPIWIVAAFPGVMDGFNLRVRFSGAMMPAAPDNLARLDQHRANHRVGRSHSVPSPGEAQRQAHGI